jgi:hypothetical protein
MQNPPDYPPELPPQDLPPKHPRVFLPPQVGQTGRPKLIIAAPVDDSSKGSLGLGFIVGIVGNMIFAGIGFFLSQTLQSVNAMWALGTLGISQVIWLVPVAIFFGVKDDSRTVAGLLLAGGLIFLLNVVLIASGVAFILALCGGAR